MLRVVVDLSFPGTVMIATAVLLCARTRNPSHQNEPVKQQHTTSSETKESVETQERIKRQNRRRKINGVRKVSAKGMMSKTSAEVTKQVLRPISVLKALNTCPTQGSLEEAKKLPRNKRAKRRKGRTRTTQGTVEGTMEKLPPNQAVPNFEDDEEGSDTLKDVKSIANESAENVVPH